jgi:hypothetical protein
LYYTSGFHSKFISYDSECSENPEGIKHNMNCSKTSEWIIEAFEKNNPLNKIPFFAVFSM